MSLVFQSFSGTSESTFVDDSLQKNDAVVVVAVVVEVENGAIGNGFTKRPPKATLGFMAMPQMPALLNPSFLLPRRWILT